MRSRQEESHHTYMKRHTVVAIHVFSYTCVSDTNLRVYKNSRLLTPFARPMRGLAQFFF